MTEKIIEIEGKKYKLVEIVEQVEENKGRWIPEVGEDYYYLDSLVSKNTAYWANDNIDNLRLSIGNVHKTSEQLELYKQYQIAMNVPSTAKKGEGFWFWSFESNEPVLCVETYESQVVLSVQFATRAECQAWGDTHAENVKKYRESLLNN